MISGIDRSTTGDQLLFTWEVKKLMFFSRQRLFKTFTTKQVAIA